MDQADIEQTARSALQRVLEQNARKNPRATILMGQSTVYLGQAVQALVMQAPCRCKSRAQSLFMASTPALAMREATEFVKAILESNEEHESED